MLINFRDIFDFKKVSEVIEEEKEEYFQEARLRLLDSAAKLFAEKGYTDTSVREIVDLAGVTKPVLYYYFKNKEGIFKAILELAETGQKEALAEVISSTGHFMTRLLNLFQTVREGVSSNENLFKLINTLIMGPSHGMPEYDLEAFTGMLTTALKQLYLDARENGEVIDADPDAVALMFLGLIHLFIQNDLSKLWHDDESMPEHVLNLAFSGLKA